MAGGLANDRMLPSYLLTNFRLCVGVLDQFQLFRRVLHNCHGGPSAISDLDRVQKCLRGVSAIDVDLVDPLGLRRIRHPNQLMDYLGQAQSPFDGDVSLGPSRFLTWKGPAFDTWPLFAWMLRFPGRKTETPLAHVCTVGGALRTSHAESVPERFSLEPT